MDLGSAKEVDAVVIQKRTAYSQYVTKVTLQTSLDGSTWTNVNSGNQFAASQSGDGVNYKRVLTFSSSRVARYVKIKVVSWNNHISMRVAVREVVGAGACQACTTPSCPATKVSGTCTLTANAVCAYPAACPCKKALHGRIITRPTHRRRRSHWNMDGGSDGKGDHCEGDCDKNSHCESGLVCVHDDNGIYSACGGDRYGSSDHCVDSTWNYASNPLGLSTAASCCGQ